MGGGGAGGWGELMFLEVEVGGLKENNNKKNVCRGKKGVREVG